MRYKLEKKYSDAACLGNVVKQIARSYTKEQPFKMFKNRYKNSDHVFTWRILGTAPKRRSHFYLNCKAYVEQ